MEVLKPRAAAAYIGCSEWKLRELAARGDVPHFRIGNRLLFRRAALEEWVIAKEQGRSS